MALKTRDTTTTTRGSGDRTTTQQNSTATKRPGIQTRTEVGYTSAEEVTEETTDAVSRQTQETSGPQKQISHEDKGFVISFRIPVMGLGGKCSTTC